MNAPLSDQRSRGSVALAANGMASTGVSAWSVSALVLAGLCCCTAVAVVYTKHLSRTAWADISASRQVIDDLNVEWSRLQLEESTVSDYGRIERAATERLAMRYPELSATRLIVREVQGQ